MCRLFGFRSIIKSQVHSSLVGADDSLMTLSSDHPDGWGVAYYVEGAPHVMKSESAAINDHLFRRVSGVVASETVIAHLRKATLGTVNIANTHPFQFGKWVFAHNGNIDEFTKFKPALLNLIPPQMQRYILGDTDSEILFFILLSELKKLLPASDSTVNSKQLVDATRSAVKRVKSIIGEFEDKHSDPKLTYLTFLMTDGENFIAHHGGQPLWKSTYKSRCAERDTCASFSDECEAPTKTGIVNHLLFSSEPISGENTWLEMQPGEIMTIDGQMKIATGSSRA